MSTRYAEFLDGKRIRSVDVGFPVADPDISDILFPFQRRIVQWAVRRGRAAIFADTGLGKSLMQVEWARHVHLRTGQPVLILAPLAVAQQTVREGQKIGVDITVCRSGDDVQPGINITNYERLHRFDPGQFAGIVLDESSILKGFNSKTRKQISEFVAGIHYRLACTATPAPNDLIEITNHAEFLAVMSGKEIIALFFTQDGNTTHKWRLKGHAREDFWKWLASWCVAVRSPADLGFDDDRFVLPPLHLEQHTTRAALVPGTLFALEALSLQDRQRARRESVVDRVKQAAEIVNASTEPFLVWCDLNAESQALAKAIPDAIEVTGSDTIEHKEDALLGFADGRYRVLISKPSICGFGMNWQHCNQMVFVGLSDSWEQQYQAIRRCWRFGQHRPVTVHVIASEAEGAVVRNIERKDKQAAEMMAEVVKHMQIEQKVAAAGREEMEYAEQVAIGKDWRLYLGDCVEWVKELESDSIGLSVFSPPFPGMYAYTNSARDIGNTTGIEEMIDHFRFLVPELFRVLKPGRTVAVHLCQLTAMQSRDGFIGLKDYRGRVIELFGEFGFHYAAEATIEKNPQIQAVRNKERGLMFKSLANDASVMRMALADYLIGFRKPGENFEPIRAGISKKYGNPNGWITEQEWIEWASPIWPRARKGFPGGIRETNVLNVAQARETDDERHLCPLQLDVIERAIKLWSNPGDVVLDPFNGIGSTGVEALRLGRRYRGIELKESYWRTSVTNLRKAETTKEQPSLFDTLEEVPA